MEIGNPKNHMELMNPNCSAFKPKDSPNCGRIPARIEKEKAVVMSARQLALKSALLLIGCVINKCFRFLGCVNSRIDAFKVAKKNDLAFPKTEKINTLPMTHGLGLMLGYVQCALPNKYPILRGAQRSRKFIPFLSENFELLGIRNPIQNGIPSH